MTTRILAASAAALLLGACVPESEPLSLGRESALSRTMPAPGTQPIAAIAIEAGFTQLVDALQYVDEELDAGLVTLFMEGRGQYTVFAPTDGAFGDLYTLLGGVLEEPVTSVRDLPAPVVLDVLLYHVVQGRRPAVSVLPKRGERVLTSLQGETFAVNPGGVITDGLAGLREGAVISSPDVSASNGIIHVIDAVIVPPSVVAALTE